MPYDPCLMSRITSSPGRLLLAFVGGACIGILGGLIGLGGAEFRLPLLISLFGFAALSAVILNKAMSLVVVAAALLSRTKAVPLDDLLAHWPVVVNLLTGSLLGAWLGADWATRIRRRTLHRILAALLVLIAAVLLLGHDRIAGDLPLTGATQMAVGVAAGFGIGAVTSLMGVAGGELLIPTLVLLFGADIKLAGSLALTVSLPTMLVGFARYSRDSSFAALGRNKSFVLCMAAGSLMGASIGGYMLGVVPSRVLFPVLAAILIVSAFKVWRHGVSDGAGLH
jgi:uncharacterized protein